MTEIFYALGLFLVLEGLFYAIAPDFLRRVAAYVATSPATELRISGLVAATLGTGLLYLVRG
jgi:hypothetical protein